MLQRVSSDCLQRGTQASINTLQICDAKFQVSHLCVDMKVDGDFDRLGFDPASLSNKIQMLESIAVKAIQASIVVSRTFVKESSGSGKYCLQW